MTKVRIYFITYAHDDCYIFCFLYFLPFVAYFPDKLAWSCGNVSGF